MLNRTLVKEPVFLVFVIFVIGFFLRLYAAELDPMLHDWDERFHALVAKNMMKDPFMPMLYTHQYFGTDVYNWTYNHIWLHKQPLFLWQMALSMKLFGVSEVTLRLPSVLMGALMILLVYRISILVTAGKRTALFAALLLCFNNYYFNLIAAREGMDHNDIAFGFYVLASLWAYAEYLHKPLWYWIVLIGFFAGCAVLNKWLTGLLVFAPWGIQVIISALKDNNYKPLLHLLPALFICICVFLPWQLYILYHYHNLAMHEYIYNAKHVWEVVEGHGGDVWFYLNMFPAYFGTKVNYLVPIGVIFLLFSSSIKTRYKLFLIAAPLFVFCFFSFIVQTKMKGYFFVVAPLCLIMAGFALQQLLDYAGNGWPKKVLTIGLVVFCIINTLDYAQIAAYTNEVNYRQSKIYNTNMYKNMDKIIPEDITVVLNANDMEHVDMMFYSNRLEVYHSHIPEAEFKEVTKNGMKIAAFDSRYNHTLPDYIKNYKNLYIIPVPLK